MPKLFPSFQKCCPILCSPQHSCGVNGRIRVVVSWCLQRVRLELCVLGAQPFPVAIVCLVQLLGCRRMPRVGCWSPDFRTVESRIYTHCAKSVCPDHKGAFFIRWPWEVTEGNLERNYPFGQINWLYLWIQFLSSYNF